MLLRARRRFIRVARVLALRDSLRIGALESNRGGALQYEICQAQVDRDVGVEVFAEAKDALWSWSGESLKHYEDALSVRETELSTLRRVGHVEEDILTSQTNLASTYTKFGRREEALKLRQEVYARRRVLMPEHPRTMALAIDLANALIDKKLFTEASALARETLPIARRVCGDANDATLGLRFLLTRATILNPDATQNGLRVAKEELEVLLPTTRRIFGASHPRARLVQEAIELTNRRLSTEF